MTTISGPPQVSRDFDPVVLGHHERDEWVAHDRHEWPRFLRAAASYTALRDASDRGLS